MIAQTSSLFLRMHSFSMFIGELRCGAAVGRTTRVKLACILALAVSGSWAATRANGAPVSGKAGNGISNIIWEMPALPQAARKKNFDQTLVPIWRQVLAHRDSEMQQVACRGIRRLAAAGMPGLKVLEPDLERLADKSAFPAVRAAAIQTIVALADQAANPFLSGMDQRTHQTLVILAADPPLARWKTREMFALWLHRAGDTTLPLAVRLSAIRSLENAGDSTSAQSLAVLANDSHNPLALRLAAAAALGTLGPGRAGTMAVRLLSGPAADEQRHQQSALQNGLLALTLCRTAANAAQQAVLVRLAGGKRNVLVQGAMAALVANHAELIVHQAQAAVGNPIPDIRRLVAQVLVRHILYADRARQPGHAKVVAGKSIKWLGQLLNDRRRFVRWYCRHELIVLGRKNGLRTAVLTECRLQLIHGEPRAARQAALVLGGLMDLPSEPQLLQAALTGPRAVRVGAVVALRELRVSAPLPALLASAHKLAASCQKNVENSQTAGFHAAAFRDDNIQLAQIFQLMGILRWRQGAAYMRTFIPKTRDYAGIARASAIWALGRIYHAGRHRHILAELSDRLNDTNPLDPESPAVRAISSIVIGELGRPSDANTVYIYCGPHATDRIGMSCRWAYTRLTGKPLALPIHIISPRAGDIMPIHPLR